MTKKSAFPSKMSVKYELPDVFFLLCHLLYYTPGHQASTFNTLSPKIKICILIFCPYSFPTEVVGRS